MSSSSPPQLARTLPQIATIACSISRQYECVNTTRLPNSPNQSKETIVRVVELTTTSPPTEQMSKEECLAVGTFLVDSPCHSPPLGPTHALPLSSRPHHHCSLNTVKLQRGAAVPFLLFFSEKLRDGPQVRRMVLPRVFMQNVLLLGCPWWDLC